MKNIAAFMLILSVAAGAAGCAFIRHPREFMALKRLADNQKQIKKYLKRHEESFYRLRDDLLNNRLNKGLQKKTILSLYDEPIFCKQSGGREKSAEICLYRHPTNFFGSDMIYLAFDSENRLQSWEIIRRNGQG